MLSYSISGWRGHPYRAQCHDADGRVLWESCLNSLPQCLVACREDLARRGQPKAEVEIFSNACRTVMIRARAGRRRHP